SPVDGIRRRLDDPQVAEALNSLLDHADLLAVLVKGLDGFVRRGDDIANNLTSAIGELKAL
nr:Chain Q, Type 2 [NiFe]-hydrogenase Huc membrane adapter subunit [Mycolicibacterium smegmatis MC2 155]7UTD_R Chain R, Type 2 [NiFe]-hydrogenase Huc membrane adapter subunit [Mycolicibacterium smegmatis MC2 155]7UTD_S Chain S, Type 2 [NiFe]-hydrogenase Huc membrane adapter subunit [Mycolicibacterium smegmatis MC2 155]7UTD_T Chain T, Type 2 [NiFe]-hydrogenase Huc membrane adapter subunit [Mycolicibacterium smegmatis MC2 155]